MIDLDVFQIERVEADLDALAGQMGRGFEEVVVQQEGGIAADQAVDAMKEDAAQVGGGRKLADVVDVALPAQQGRGLERAVLAAMVDGIEPVPEALVQLLQGEQSGRIERGQELLADGTEEALDLAAAFGLVRRGMDDEDADGSGDARQLRGAVDLGVVHIEAGGDAARGDGMAETVEEGVQALVGIELGVGDEAAGIVESGLQEDLHLAGVGVGSGAADPGTEEHVGLPDLVGALGLVLFVGGGGGLLQQELARGESAGAEEAIESGRGQSGVGLAGGQFTQQCGAGPMRVLAFESLDEGGGFRRRWRASGRGPGAAWGRGRRIRRGDSGGSTPAAYRRRPGGGWSRGCRKGARRSVGRGVSTHRAAASPAPAGR